jgi:hypothetical protein
LLVVEDARYLARARFEMRRAAPSFDLDLV